MSMSVTKTRKNVLRKLYWGLMFTLT